MVTTKDLLQSKLTKRVIEKNRKKKYDEFLLLVIEVENIFNVS